VTEVIQGYRGRIFTYSLFHHLLIYQKLENVNGFLESLANTILVGLLPTAKPSVRRRNLLLLNLHRIRRSTADKCSMEPRLTVNGPTVPPISALLRHDPLSPADMQTLERNTTSNHHTRDTAQALDRQISCKQAWGATNDTM
jgi:hypothetical protein